MLLVNTKKSSLSQSLQMFPLISHKNYIRLSVTAGSVFFMQFSKQWIQDKDQGGFSLIICHPGFVSVVARTVR